MGLQKRGEGTGGGVIFADIKGNTGEIIVKGPKNSDGSAGPFETYDKVSGTVVDLSIKENDYKGETITNFQIKLDTGEAGAKPIVASVSLGSYFGAKVVGLLNAANLANPVELAVGMMKAGDKIGDKTVLKDAPWVTLRQGGQRLVPTYTEGKTDLPDAAEVMVSGKKMKDMTPVNDEVAAVVGLLYGKMEAMHEAAKVPADDDAGVNPADLAAATDDATRRSMAQRA